MEGKPTDISCRYQYFAYNPRKFVQESLLYGISSYDANFNLQLAVIGEARREQLAVYFKAPFVDLKMDSSGLCSVN